MMFHKHDWQEIIKTYSPPYPNKFKGSSLPNRVLMSAMHGITSTQYKCKYCGKIEVVEQYGSVL